MTRRISVARSASGAGLSPALRSPARMKASIGVLIQGSEIAGGATSLRGWNAQYRRSAAV